MPRDSYTLSTKFAVVDQETGEVISLARATQYVDDSLRYLQVNELDILLLAGASDGNDYSRVMDRLGPTWEQLIREGKVRHLGSSEVSSVDGGHSWLNRVLQSDLMEVVMVAYNMMNQAAERTVFPISL